MILISSLCDIKGGPNDIWYGQTLYSNCTPVVRLQTDLKYDLKHTLVGPDAPHAFCLFRCLIQFFTSYPGAVVCPCSAGVKPPSLGMNSERRLNASNPISAWHAVPLAGKHSLTPMAPALSRLKSSASVSVDRLCLAPAQAV